MPRSLLIPLLLAAASGCGGEPVSAADDLDGDGVSADLDCDDADPFVYPGAIERCNGRDDDCDGQVDGTGAAGSPRWYVDADGDGFGAGPPVDACEPPQQRVMAAGDCDDADPTVHPGVLDRCDGVDSDCDGEVDEDPDERGYRDDDGDGFGRGAVTVGCLGAGVAPVDGDCDDDAPDAFPGAVEDCTPGDEDCDGFADDDDPEGALGTTVYYPDVDGDGFGDDTRPAGRCAPPSDRVTTVPGDCDDEAADVFPGAVEACVGYDQDCDGLTAPDDAWYPADATARLMVQVQIDAEGARPVAVPIDEVALALAGVADPTRVLGVVQDCSAPRLVAAQHALLGDVLAGPGPVSTEPHVHAVLQGLEPGEHTLGLYFEPRFIGVPAVPAEADDEGIEHAELTASFDPQRGGLLDDLRLDGALVASAADLDGQHGVRVGGVLHPWSEGSVEVLSPGPVIAAVRSEASSPVASLQLLQVAYAYREGELVGRVTVTGEQAGAYQQLTSLALQRYDATAVELAWLRAPEQGPVASCDDDSCLLQGADQLSLAVAPEPLLDGGVWLLGLDAAAPVDDALGTLGAAVDLTVGPPEVAP